MEDWQRAYPESTEVVEYGKSFLGKPLRLVITQKPGAYSFRPTLLMTGSTHGNEYLNIEDRLPLELLKKSQDQASPVRKFLDRGGALIFVPIVNPDGYDSQKRENARGVDLNRDWALPELGFRGFKENESRALAEKLEAYFQSGLRYRVTVDYHCCMGAILYPYSYQDSPLPKADALGHAVLSNLASKALGVKVGTTGKILGYFPRGTTKDYYYLRYGAKAFTYEGRPNSEPRYLAQHVAWWESMLTRVLEESPSPLVTWLPSKGSSHPKMAD